ncbi:selenoprotein Pa-like [Neltuma alba]|uniref:selenoprotein Pa-like n=1 Tax=Neltuma alba TaxID=207710 RepID=UPI0010A49410|nr:selenoprotein Pa-like [Prosopis alba]XP_028804191.1 selenoprotein Pa-like [Prosopis alba]
MERVKVINLIAIVGVASLALVSKMESLHIGAPAEPRPLCASQFALANYACARLPFTPGTPPSPPPSPDDGHSHRQRHGHRHRNGHGHGHRHRHHTSQEEDCCRWVKEVDSQCVCEVLLRLPPFLVRPLHQYTVTVGDFCNATYSCGGPI